MDIAISRTNNQIKESESRESNFSWQYPYQCHNEFFTAQIWSHVKLTSIFVSIYFTKNRL